MYIKASPVDRRANGESTGDYTSAYWGPSDTSSLLCGAIVVFLFVLGIAFAEQKYVWWLVPICDLAIMMSWGSNFRRLQLFSLTSAGLQQVQVGDLYRGHGHFLHAVTWVYLVWRKSITTG
jgi:hypothetical protein